MFQRFDDRLTLEVELRVESIQGACRVQAMLIAGSNEIDDDALLFDVASVCGGALRRRVGPANAAHALGIEESGACGPVPQADRGRRRIEAHGQGLATD